MALQPFVGPRPLFQFLDPIHIRSDFLDRGSARHKASTYTRNTTQNKRTQTSMPLSEIQTHDPSVQADEDSSCLRARGYCDRHSSTLPQSLHSPIGSTALVGPGRFLVS
jgi:hypothetical protein